MVEEIQFLTPSEVEDLPGNQSIGSEVNSACVIVGSSRVPYTHRSKPLTESSSTQRSTKWRRALWHGLVSNHPFVDGNKRVGTAVADVFLLVNGIEMTFSTEEVIEITMALATSNLDRADLSDRIARNSRLLKP